jgi:hypothetical protein
MPFDLGLVHALRRVRYATTTPAFLAHLIRCAADPVWAPHARHALARAGGGGDLRTIERLTAEARAYAIGRGVRGIGPGGLPWATPARVDGRHPVGWPWSPSRYDPAADLRRLSARARMAGIPVQDAPLSIALAELAHLLIGHRVVDAAHRPAVLPSMPWSPPLAVRGVEAAAAAFLTIVRRGGAGGESALAIARHLEAARREFVLEEIDLIRVFAAAEILMAWSHPARRARPTRLDRAGGIRGHHVPVARPPRTPDADRGVSP